MSKTELEAWARDRHGVDLDRRRRKETLIEQVRALDCRLIFKSFGLSGPIVAFANRPAPGPLG